MTIPVDLNELVTALNMRGFEVGSVDIPTQIPDHLRADEAILDIEVTMNRPDCLSIIGIAREIATIYDTPLKLPQQTTQGVTEDAQAKNDALSVVIEATDLCPHYIAGLVDVDVSESPEWMINRLQAIGIRPINNVVDSSNYVLMEMGHPTHAFDLEQLAGQALKIRRAKKGERIQTLDGVDRQLKKEMLVIADANQPQAIAGIMGGTTSEVSDNTRTVVIESAYFQPTSVRHTSKQLGLSTEASYRFERGVDVCGPALALARVHTLLEKIGAVRKRGPIINHYPVPFEKSSIRLRHSRLRRLLGQTIEKELLVRLLENLGFKLVPLVGPELPDDDNWWNVEVPSHRIDVHREADIIEEIARHYGYDRLPTTFPPLTQPPDPIGPWLEQARLIRRILTISGFSEAITFTFIDRSAAVAFHQERELVELANPLSEQLTVLRPSLLPGIIDSLVYNRRRERHDIRLFELGNCFSLVDGEIPRVAMICTGASNADHWSGPTRSLDLFDIKGVVERLCNAFGVKPEFDVLSNQTLVPGRAASVRAKPTPPEGSDGSKQIELGNFGQLSPTVAEAHGFPSKIDEVYVAEIDLRALTQINLSRDSFRVKPPPRYPSMVRDLSILLDESLPASSVRESIRSVAGQTLAEIKEFDRYRGEGIPKGLVSLSLRLTFQSSERTLTDTEVQQTMTAVVSALEKTYNASVR